MTPSKAKGSATERAIVTHLRAAGFPNAERRLAGSAKDRGDIAGLIGVVIEVKNGARCDLAAWVDEAVMERLNDGAAVGVVWHKRRGVGDPARWFVTMTGADFTHLLRAAGYGDPP